MSVDATVWGPHFWFVLHSMAATYPEYPNDITKRKYYDFVHNLRLFLPNEEMGNRFCEMLDKYPVSPYLDNRNSFWRWTVFVHNKINVQLGKLEMEVDEARRIHQEWYAPKPIIEENYGNTQIKRSVVYINMAIILSLILVAYLLH